MGAPTYTSRGIVLRKTKLGEADLIVTVLSEDGSQLRAVAKGACKPSSGFASRLELYARVELLLAKGKSLDIVKEARLIAGNEALRCDLELSSAAAPMVELLERVTQIGLDNERLYALTCRALERLCDADAAHAPAVTAAHLLKTLAFCGLRPSFESCVGCGVDVRDDGGNQGAHIVEQVREFREAYATDLLFSYREGGVVCCGCRPHYEAVHVPVATIDWARFYLGSTFDAILDCEASLSASFAVLSLCKQWVREHVGVNLKSLDFMFTCGLFLSS